VACEQLAHNCALYSVSLQSWCCRRVLRLSDAGWSRIEAVKSSSSRQTRFRMKLASYLACRAIAAVCGYQAYMILLKWSWIKSPVIFWTLMWFTTVAQSTELRVSHFSVLSMERTTNKHPSWWLIHTERQECTVSHHEPLAVAYIHVPSNLLSYLLLQRC
jgi:hypothetical protein